MQSAIEITQQTKLATVTNSKSSRRLHITPPHTFNSIRTTSPQKRCVAAAAVAEEEDLWQYPDRDQWYAARFAANDQPDWNAARFVRSTELGPGLREIVLDVEISRERIPIRNAYKHVGQRAAVRMNGGVEIEAVVSSPPFPEVLIKDALYRTRGDMSANETKKVVEESTIRAELSLFVSKDATPDLYKAADDDLFEVGPFIGGGLNLRGPVSAIFLTSTLVMFVEGDGIATAKSLIQATPDVGGLSPELRADVVVYYRAKNAAELCYQPLFDEWAQKYKVRVTTSTRDSFQDMFDDDDMLMYDPETTAAIVLTGMNDEEAEAAALEVCKEAEITNIVKQTEEQPMTEYLVTGKKEK